MLLKLARASLWNRRGTIALTLFTIALSVALLLAVERLREGARRGFASSVSGTDLVVGARTSPLQLLLYSVFHIGDASANLRWDSYEVIAALPEIRFAIPITLGDSHRGYRVLGTEVGYFEHFRHGRRQALVFAAGRAFAGAQEVVLGAEVARQLRYRIGDSLVIAHGGGRHDILRHDEAPFRVVGVLAATGTPVDRTLHVSLESLEAIHADWRHGVRLPGSANHAEAAPRTLSAVFLGLHNRAAALGLQRRINEYTGEPLLAILPALTLAQLWSLTAVAENALRLVAACVVLAGLLGLCGALLTALEQRRRELAILRALGARPWQIAALLLIESGAITLAGAVAGALLLVLTLAAAGPWLLAEYGVPVAPLAFTPREACLLALVLAAGLAAGLLPAWRAWRRTLADGLTLRT
ncbi:MAG: ABC transporter permease [Xanthomonadales bacterium]|nr:hypothetical protein [Xanthomonadales bacterium]MCC6593559.1 ABC transporter permease [Xanthomonadales bacterium]MCE7932289.1 ABC transporter permease [Xanthomonadales bacterium PRO6]